MTAIHEVLFLDIETVKDERYLQESERTRLFKKRFDSVSSAGQKQWEDIHDENAALTAEFGKVVNISLGMVKPATDGTHVLTVKSMCSKDEHKILSDLALSLEKSKPGVLCAHNGLEFDFPFIYRRMIINGITVPNILDAYEKKPWTLQEQLHDTLKMWGHTAFKHNRGSLELLCYILGIPSPKTDIDGSKIGELWYGRFDDLPKDQLPFDAEEAVVKKISDYGAGDVVSLVRLYLKLSGSKITISDEQIKRVEYK